MLKPRLLNLYKRFSQVCCRIYIIDQRFIIGQSSLIDPDCSIFCFNMQWLSCIWKKYQIPQRQKMIMSCKEANPKLLSNWEVGKGAKDNLKNYLWIMSCWKFSLTKNRYNKAYKNQALLQTYNSSLQSWIFTFFSVLSFNQSSNSWRATREVVV